MTFRCTSVRTIQPQTVCLALHIAPYDLETINIAPDEHFQCQLDDVEHETHAAFLRDTPEEGKDVWFGWSSEDCTQFVFLLGTCGRQPKDEMDSCSLFERHPGLCNWEYVDPQRLAIDAEVDQALCYLRDHGALPPRRVVEGS